MFDEDFVIDAPTTPRIYKHTNLRTDFRSIDFNKQVLGDSLFPVRDVEFGVIKSINWFDAPGGELVIREVNDYTYEVPGVIQSLPVQRVKTLTWFQQNGEAHPLTKMVRKLYLFPQNLQAAARRREMLIVSLEAEIFGRFAVHFATDGETPSSAIGFFTANSARVLRSYLEPGVNEYLISGNHQVLTDLFNNSPNSLLDAPTAEFASLREQSIARLL